MITWICITAITNMLQERLPFIITIIVNQRDWDQA